MPTHKNRPGGLGANTSKQELATGTQGPNPGKPTRFDGRKNTNAGTDLSVRGRANDPSPSIVHWTRTT